MQRVVGGQTLWFYAITTDLKSNPLAAPVHFLQVFAPYWGILGPPFPPFLLTNWGVVIAFFLLSSHQQVFLKPSQGPLYLFDGSGSIRKDHKNACRKSAKEKLQFFQGENTNFPFFLLFVFFFYFGFSLQLFFPFYQQTFLKPPMISYYFLDCSKSSRKGLKTACR